MIEVVTGERGHAVIRCDGRLLASRFDPVTEAQSWLARRSEFLEKVKTVFVLGLGSGYHIAALLKQTRADILVIEPNAELIAAVEKIHSFEGRRVKIECVNSARGLRASRLVRAAVSGSFTVLTFPASKAGQPEMYQELAAQLTGRDWGALTWQWQIKNGPSLDSTPRVTTGQSELTIYDLEQTELVQNSEERERMLLKALRELVK